MSARGGECADPRRKPAAASVRRHPPRKRCPYCGHPVRRETDKTCEPCNDLPLLDKVLNLYARATVRRIPW